MEKLFIDQAITKASELWDSLNLISKTMNVDKEIKLINELISELQKKAVGLK